MLTDEQARLVAFALFGVVTVAVAFGFVRALMTGEVAIGYQPNSALSKIVRRADHPGAYLRIMMGWAFMLLLCIGLLAIPIFGM